jgi:ribosomal protein S18 acetylase RimI-like enzyme
VPLAEQHIPALRRINSLLLPVPYPDSFYAKALDPLASGLFSRAILWQDSDADAPKVVGGLVCRLEPNPFLDPSGEPIPNPSPPTNPQKPSSIPLDTPYHAIYIQSLVLLSPYRSLGLAAAALDHIIASAALLPAAGSSVDARTIYAHVWTDNEDGLKWYEARGFAREGREPVKGYYFKLRPDTAWVVRRHISAAAGGVGVGPAFFAHGAAAHASPAMSATIPSSTTATELQDFNKPPKAKAGAATVLAAAVNLPPMTAPPPAAAAPPPPRAGGGPPSQAGPPRRPSPSPTPSTTTTTSSLSFQKARPETEWNDLPADMVNASSGGGGPGKTTTSSSSNTPPQLLSPPPSGAAGTPASGRSSRSSSTAPARKKRERAYPTAAFGGQ